MILSVPVIFKTVQFLQGEDGKKSQGGVDQEQIKVWCQKYKLQCTMKEYIVLQYILYVLHSLLSLLLNHLSLNVRGS